MAKAVFLHRPNSIYDDLPEERYQFPKQYRAPAFDAVGDWIIYNELSGGKGSSGYSSMAQIDRIERDPADPDMYYAYMVPGSFLSFESFVPYRDGSNFLESRLTTGTNRPTGVAQSAVRFLPDLDFFRIVQRGNPLEELPRFDDDLDDDRSGEFREAPEPFVFDYERELVSSLVTRPVRKRIFRTRVINAYDKRCAFTGMQFVNGLGRAEVQAAHIKPVEAGGPDSIRNGIALSGTIHWMFDRGMISLSDELEILVSRHVNDVDRVWSLMSPDRKAVAPEQDNLRPHPSFLEWHRQNRFKH